MPRVPGLPTAWAPTGGRDLSRCPDSPSGPDDPRRETLAADWLRWRQDVLAYRRYRHDACAGLVEGKDALDEQAKELHKITKYGPKYWITIWSWFYEERTDQLFAGGGWLPAIPFPFQYDLIDWIERRLNARGRGRNGVIRKSRDVGGTDICCRVFTYHFLFDAPFSCKAISRRADLVDNEGDMDSLFERIALHFPPDPEEVDDPEEVGPSVLPAWQLPPNWNPRIHRRKNKLRRPDNRNIFRGESTSRRSARGGRSGVGFVDEAAFIDKLAFLLGALQNAASHIILCSSESIETSEDFVEYAEQMAAIDPDCVFAIDYWVHPFHDEAWLAQMREDAPSEEAFQREVMRNAYAGFGGFLYPDAPATVLPDRIAYQSGTELLVGIDPGRRDQCALHWVMVDPVGGRDVLLESFEDSAEPPEYYAAIVLGCDPDELEARYDGNQPLQAGAPPLHLKFGREARELMAWTRTLPQPRIFGDPYGANTSVRKGDSWYDAMLTFSILHNPRTDERTKRGFPLIVLTKWLPDERGHQGRRIALMNWLPRLDFNNTKQAALTLNAIRKSRFETEDRRASEQAEPMHDALSHRRTALEFVAVNLATRRRATSSERPAAYFGKGSRAQPMPRSSLPSLPALEHVA